MDLKVKQEDGAPRYGVPDVSKAGRQIWLVKVPERMAELFDSAKPGADLTKLTFGKDEEGKNVVRT